jgi:4-hydroxy-tetrahydrodipicolinate reductase
MQVIVVGSGKLATELLGSLKLGSEYRLTSWDAGKAVVGETAAGKAAAGETVVGETVAGKSAAGEMAAGMPVAERSIVVHAGSGRELPDVVAFCRATASTLIELSTGSGIERMSAGVPAAGVPVVLCPNTNVLMLKFMHMLESSGHLFHDYKIGVVESHQASKTSVPGTAVAIARSLGLADAEIQSIREPDVQCDRLRIPKDQLERHAFHRIRIEDGECSIEMETRVVGASPYADGVARIVDAVRRHDLDRRVYSVMELVANGWL